MDKNESNIDSIVSKNVNHGNEADSDSPNRKSWKIAYFDRSLLKKVMALSAQPGAKPSIKTKARNSTIIPPFVGFNIEVYNGKAYIPVFIHSSMIGHKLGEFSPTRKFTKHSGKKKDDKRR